MNLCKFSKIGGEVGKGIHYIHTHIVKILSN